MTFNELKPGDMLVSAKGEIWWLFLGTYEEEQHWLMISDKEEPRPHMSRASDSHQIIAVFNVMREGQIIVRNF